MMETQNKSTEILGLVHLLVEAIERGSIMNADLNDLKYKLSKEFDRDYEVVRAVIMPLYRQPETRTYPLIEALDYMPHYIHGIKAYAKRIEKLRTALPAEVMEALEEFLPRWTGALELLQQVKPLVVKGRRPSTEPRKTDPRTLENTGTCPVCNRNAKLDKFGRMVAHGYKVEWHSQYGNCHGVSQPPVEVSDKGLKFYLNLCQKWMEGVQACAERLRSEPLLIDPSLPEDEKRRRRQARVKEEQRVASTIRNLEYSIPQIEKSIAEWAPRPLPGVVAGFDR